MRTVTSSFRMSRDLRRRLEETARSLKKRKNWIIIEALEEYLQRKHRAALAAEARRQSLLVRAAEHEDDNFWDQLADTNGWQ
jgi:predicted transcriptional regulator